MTSLSLSLATLMISTLAFAGVACDVTDASNIAETEDGVGIGGVPVSRIYVTTDKEVLATVSCYHRDGFEFLRPMDIGEVDFLTWYKGKDTDNRDIIFNAVDAIDGSALTQTPTYNNADHTLRIHLTKTVRRFRVGDTVEAKEADTKQEVSTQLDDGLGATPLR